MQKYKLIGWSFQITNPRWYDNWFQIEFPVVVEKDSDFDIFVKVPTQIDGEFAELAMAWVNYELVSE